MPRTSLFAVDRADQRPTLMSRTQLSRTESLRVAIVGSDDLAGTLDGEFDVESWPAETPAKTVLATRPHVVLVDVREREALQAVVNLSRDGTQPVVVLGPPREPEAAMRYLDMGASDYLPWHMSQIERLARIRAAARQYGRGAQSDSEADFEQGNLSVSLSRYEVMKDGEQVHLTPNEFRLLEALLERPGSVISHRELIARVWGVEHLSAKHYLRIYVRQLREKLEDDPARPEILLTVRGIGYQFGVSAAEEVAASS